MKRSTGDIADEFYYEHLQNKHRHSASVSNLNTLNMGVKSSTESFANPAFASFSNRNSKIPSVRPKTGIDTRKNKEEKYKTI